MGAALQADGEYEVRGNGLKHQMEKRSMEHFAGLDVSVKESRVCIVDDTRQHWAGFPDFKVRVKRLLAVGNNNIVTENEWSGTHLGKFLGYPPTGKRAKVRALVVWHFKGKRLWGETVFFDMGMILKKIGARITIPRSRRKTSRRRK